MLDYYVAQARQYIPNLQRILRFGTVGVGGTALNSILLWLLVQRVGWTIAPASALATEAAVIHNFLLNDLWTFHSHARQNSRLARLVRFNGVSLSGLCLTVTIVVVGTQ